MDHIELISEYISQSINVSHKLTTVTKIKLQMWDIENIVNHKFGP